MPRITNEARREAGFVVPGAQPRTVTETRWTALFM
jgi:hypothetical protein